MGYVHRDIKPENVVMQFVTLLSFREFPKSVISAGLPLAMSPNYVLPIVEHRCIFHQKWSKRKNTTTQLISGL